MLDFPDEGEMIAPFPAAVAVVELFLRTDIEGWGLLLVEGAQSLEVAARLLQPQVLRDQVHQVQAVLDLLDGVLLHGGHPDSLAKALPFPRVDPTFAYPSPSGGGSGSLLSSDFPSPLRGGRIQSVNATPGCSDVDENKRPRASAGRSQPSVLRGRRFIWAATNSRCSGPC